MNKIVAGLLLYHFLIIIIVLVIIGFVEKDETFILVSVFILFLYFISGYILTTDKIKWINYFIIAIIGILFWIICFVNSPNSMNYKSDNNAGVWFFYQLYIIVSSPINLINIFDMESNYSVNKQLIIDLLIPIILSLMQFLGGIVKINRLKISNL
jgi:hypothetical protein